MWWGVKDDEREVSKSIDRDASSYASSSNDNIKSRLLLTTHILALSATATHSIPIVDVGKERRILIGPW